MKNIILSTLAIALFVTPVLANATEKDKAEYVTTTQRFDDIPIRYLAAAIGALGVALGACPNTEFTKSSYYTIAYLAGRATKENYDVESNKGDFELGIAIFKNVVEQEGSIQKACDKFVFDGALKLK